MWQALFYTLLLTVNESHEGTKTNNTLVHLSLSPFVALSLFVLNKAANLEKWFTNA